MTREKPWYITTLGAPGTQPLAMLLCGLFWGSNRNHNCLLVLVMRPLATSIPMYLCACTYTELEQIMHYYDTYHNTVGIFVTVNITRY